MKTKQINIIAANNCVGSSLLGMLDFIQIANTFWKYSHPQSEEPILSSRVYGCNGDQIRFSNGISISALPIDQYEPGDAVFVISSFSHDQEALQNYLTNISACNEVLHQERDAGKIIASYCTGTFALAQSGLLDDGPATTVWWMKNIFQEMYPKIHLVLDDLIVEHGNVITGGATTSHFNVFMRIAEKLTNSIFAIQLSKILLLDKHRLSQQPFMDSSLIQNKQDDMVEDVQNWMMQNFQESTSLDEIASKFAVSKRTLIRRFKNACGETPLNYLQRIRVERAKHYLETTSLPVEQIVEKVGYGDSASFRKLFSTMTQLSPKAYRERFSFNPACCA